MADNVTESGTSSSLCNWPAEKRVDYLLENYPVIYVELIFYPILLAICTVGNVLCIVVLSTEKTKTTTNVYLICVAVGDLLVLWLSLPEYIILAADQQLLLNDRFAWNYQNYYGFGKWVLETSVQFSDWTLIIFSLERFLAVTRPFQFRPWRTIPVVIVTEMVVLLLAAIFTLQNIVTWYYFITHDDGKSNANQILPQALINWSPVQNQAEIGVTIAKWLALIVISSIFMVVLAKQSKARSEVLKHDSDPSAAANYRNSNLILIASVLLYFFTQFPNVIYKCMEVASRPPYCTYNLTHQKQDHARPFIFIATLCNYSLGFLVYCAVSRKFRGLVTNLFTNLAAFCCPGCMRAYLDMDDRRKSSVATVLSSLPNSRTGSLEDSSGHVNAIMMKSMPGNSAARRHASLVHSGA